MDSTLARFACGTALLATMITATRPVTASGSLYDAVRASDLAALTARVDAGADVNLPDDTGATPLMYAALYAGPDCLQLLIARGARVNVANKYGATPLMWAAASRAVNVELLLQHGADANARASDGVTPLVVAARFDRGDSMRALLAAGADTKNLETRTQLLTAAYFAPTAQAREVLKRVSVEVASRADVSGPVLNRNRGDLPTLSQLLAADVDAKEEVPLITLSLPSFFIAAREGQLEAVQAFVAHGADPHYTGARGWTALMLAAGGDTPSLAVMRYLLAPGADVNARDEDGRTALDWAETRGHTEVVTFLTSAGAVNHATPSPPPSPAQTPRSPAVAIERAIARLQPAGPAFYERTRCNSCHNQNIPGIAITLAERHGVRIDEALAGHSMQATNAQMRVRREGFLLGDTTGGGFQANSLYTLLEMAEARMPATPNSDAIVLGLASRQGPDGSWPVAADIRPPLTGSTLTSTALAIRGLSEYAPEGRREELRARVDKALTFVRQATPRDTQEQVFKLLGLVWGEASQSELDRAKTQLAALQRADGGWAQLPTLQSDAYATGQALYALHAAQVSATHDIYRHGTDFLLRTQLEDGTWFVRTRAFGFQPYFETGFPHGRSQFISTVATSWASIALSYTLE